MHKQIVQFVLFLASLVGIFYMHSAFGEIKAVSSPDLVSASQLDVQKSSDVPSLPSSLNGNVDCIQDGQYDCVIDTGYGKFSSSGSVKRNKTSSYYQLISFVDNRAHSIAIPNSNTIINYTTEPPYGFYLYFTKNFSSSVTTTPIFGSYQYQINRLYDAKLVDKTNHRLAADYASISFSANGQWMIVSMPNVATLRVNLETFEVLPFASGFNYTIGLDPAVKTGITNDGRYAVLASKTFGRFEVYDLNSCDIVPDTINGPVSCQSKNLQTLMQQKVPGYISVGQVRFVNDDTLRLYANYNTGSGNKIAPFLINPFGTGAHQHDYLALGDSYISGEGAYNYLQGTNTDDNKCHVSLLSYPYLLSHDLNYNSFHSVACSGAQMNDIIDTGDNLKSQASPRTTKKQLNDTNRIPSIVANFQPGYIDQLDFVTTYQPQVITLSVGGNDVGFTDILASCVSPLNLSTCYSTYEDRLELIRQINAQFPNLVSTYQTLKNNSPPDTHIYIIGYPQIVKPGGNCGINVQLNADELVFAQQFTNYLDTVIQQAAAKAGVYYVDTQNAFNGHRLCEAGPGKFAVNGLTKGSDFPKLLGGFIHWPLGNESYHPTPLGYGLLRDTVLATTNSLSAAMPTANSSAAPPAETGLDILSAPHSGRIVSATSFDDNIAGDILPRAAASDIFVSGLDDSLKPLSSYRAELHSSPVILGNFTSSSAGDLFFQVTIPSNTPTGFHSLHIYGTNAANELVDIYKTIYVAGSGDDYNGNGIPNDTDPCIFVDASGQDIDQDGIDDACDGMITDPPPATPAAVDPEPTVQAAEIVLQPALLPSVVVPSVSAINITEDSEANFNLDTSQTSQNVLSLDTTQVLSYNAVITTSNSSSQAIVSSSTDSFFSLYYSASAELGNPAVTLPTPNPKVLGAQTITQPNHKSSMSKIVLGSIVSTLGVFFGIILSRKIGL